MRRAPTLLCYVVLASLGCAQAPLPAAAAWPEADQLFRNDPLWLGSDGAYSTDLGDGRVLWLFGDTGVARDAGRSGDTSFFIRNSLAIQSGYDPSRAFIAFYWSLTDGNPSSFIPEDGGSWFWPGGAARAGDGLVIFGQRLVNPGASPGFAAAGNVALFIANPDADPSTWQPRDAHLPSFGSQMILGSAVMTRGEFIYCYGQRDGDSHDYVVARFQLTDAAAGDLSRPEFFTAGTWIANADLTGLPDPLFTLGAPESSVNYQPDIDQYVMTQTEGFGATTLALRSAPAPEGPWTPPRTFFRPEESFLDGTFVYAGKAHPELTGADLVATYFPSTFSGSPPLPFSDDFYPRFVKVTF